MASPEEAEDDMLAQLFGEGQYADVQAVRRMCVGVRTPTRTRRQEDTQDSALSYSESASGPAGG